MDEETCDLSAQLSFLTSKTIKQEAINELQYSEYKKDDINSRKHDIKTKQVQSADTSKRRKTEKEEISEPWDNSLKKEGKKKSTKTRKRVIEKEKNQPADTSKKQKTENKETLESCNNSKKKEETKKRKSATWQYFDKNPETVNKVTCCVCNKELSRKQGSTSSLILHLKSVHEIDITEKKESQKQKLCSKVNLLPKDSAKYKAIMEAITRMTVTDLQPYEFVENASFLHLMSLVAPDLKFRPGQHIREMKFQNYMIKLFVILKMKWKLILQKIIRIHDCLPNYYISLTYFMFLIK